MLHGCFESLRVADGQFSASQVAPQSAFGHSEEFGCVALEVSKRDEDVSSYLPLLDCERCFERVAMEVFLHFQPYGGLIGATEPPFLEEKRI